MEKQSLSELYQELIEKEGDEVLIRTKDCVIWNVEHKNCEGCPSELGCGKLVSLMLVGVRNSGYQPKDYDDFLNMHKRTQELQDKILKAKTVDEIHQLV